MYASKHRLWQWPSSLYIHSNYLLFPFFRRTAIWEMYVRTSFPSGVRPLTEGEREANASRPSVGKGGGERKRGGCITVVIFSYHMIHICLFCGVADAEYGFCYFCMRASCRKETNPPRNGQKYLIHIINWSRFGFANFGLNILAILVVDIPSALPTVPDPDLTVDIHTVIAHRGMRRPRSPSP